MSGSPAANAVLPRVLHFRLPERKNGTSQLSGGNAALQVQHERRPRRTVGFAARDITADVNAAVRDTGIRAGIAYVSCSDPGCCVRVNELAPGLLQDFAALLRRLLPDEGSPVSMLLGPAGEAIPVSGGQLLLGRLQRVLLLELHDACDGAWRVEVVGAP
jgi:thiamine phosphate synthase YjbQ (UPF0047 family)